MTDAEYKRKQFLRTMADLERWQIRQAEEAIALGIAERANVDNYHVSRGITGEPSEKNRVYRATEDTWIYGLSDPRLAYTEDDSETKILNTVKVTKNGITKTIPRSEVRRKRAKKTVIVDNRVSVDRTLHARMGSNHEGDI